MDQVICKRAVLAAVTAMAKDSRLPKAKVSAIRVFLRGIDSTPYKDAYALYSDIWGSLPRVSKAEIEESLVALAGEKKLSLFRENDTDYYLPYGYTPSAPPSSAPKSPSKNAQKEKKTPKTPKNPPEKSPKYEDDPMSRGVDYTPPPMASTPPTAVKWGGDDKLLKGLQNKAGARVFSPSTFDAFVRWADTFPPHSYEGETYGGYGFGRHFVCDSQSEILLLSYIKTHGIARDCFSQKPPIPYSTAFSERRLYFPDFVLHTKEGHIALIECKPQMHMSNHLVLSKYRALAAYAKQYGFAYGMVDPDKNCATFESLAQMKIHQKVWEQFATFLNKPNPAPDDYFDESDLFRWYARCDGVVGREQFRLEIASLVIRYGLYNIRQRDAFLVFRTPVKVEKE